MTVIRCRVSYHNGDAEQGRLELYEAGRSIQGLARALSITTHALLHDGEVRAHGDRADGATIYVQPSQRGSFVEQVAVVIADPFVQAIGSSVIGAAFYDILRTGWSHATGHSAEPQTPTLQRMAERRQEILEELAAGLERPLEELHRPIKRQPVIEIKVTKPRGEALIRLDDETRQYVSTRTQGDDVNNLKGNVTRYNILSGFGRFYNDGDGVTVPFNLAEDLPAREVQLISWSLDQANRGSSGKVLFDVVPVVNARGIVRRYLVKAVRDVPPDNHQRAA